ncbi:MAG: DUF962 domain-containing protein [Halobacteriovoraceae bacterium]|jgi:hypothetical protein|nr:DUF962 domain-containing protein [Halobacteriovoraceae bacterium]MBT5094147.1 DUF962 domain-containing protein [Halobacteriovoraceae bacterium]
MKTENFETFKEFYPFYLSQHGNRVCRGLHFVGTSLVLGWMLLAIYANRPVWLFGCLLWGYGFAWVGHYIFEKNRPATFRYPFYSLLGDFAMYWDILRGRLKL